MQFVAVPFDCKGCGKKLEAHIAATTGISGGWITAKCPECGLEQGCGNQSFPSTVLHVIERQAELEDSI